MNALTSPLPLINTAVKVYNIIGNHLFIDLISKFPKIIIIIYINCGNGKSCLQANVSIRCKLNFKKFSTIEKCFKFRKKDQSYKLYNRFEKLSTTLKHAL